MKKTTMFFAIAAALFLTAGIARAHPPKDIAATWDKAHETLHITAQHSVNDPNKHFVLTMTVLEGNQQLLMKQYSQQGSAEQFSDTVLLKGLKSGTKLRVQLVCNIMGSQETEVTIQ